MGSTKSLPGTCPYDLCQLVIEFVTQLFDWYTEILKADCRGLTPKGCSSRGARKGAAFEMMSRAKEFISRMYGAEFADQLGKVPYERLVEISGSQTPSIADGAIYKHLKSILNSARAPSNSPNSTQALVASRQILSEVLVGAEGRRLPEPPHIFFHRSQNLAALLINIHQWASNIALENPLHLVDEPFSIVPIQELDFPPIKAKDFHAREPRYYIPLHTQVFQWQGLAATFAEMLPNASQDIQYHEEKERTTVYGHKIVRYKPK